MSREYGRDYSCPVCGKGGTPNEVRAHYRKHRSHNPQTNANARKALGKRQRAKRRAEAKTAPAEEGLPTIAIKRRRTRSLKAKDVVGILCDECRTRLALHALREGLE